MAHRRIPGTIAWLLVCALAAACGRFGSLADSTCALRFDVSPDSLTLTPGEAATLRAQRSATCFERVSWYSADTTIAIVASLPGDSARVLGVRAGTTHIYGQPVYEWDIWERTPVTVRE